MKWLTELVESSHSSVEALPVPCLCEFLMAGYQDKGGAPAEPEADPSSHRAQYKRKKTAKEKVCVASTCLCDCMGCVYSSMHTS